MAARAGKQQQQTAVEQSPSVRVEIRVGGRVRFSNDVYDVQLVQDESTISLTAATHPTMVNVATRPPERFGTDPRDGEEVIQKVHTGRRKPVEPEVVEPELPIAKED